MIELTQASSSRIEGSSNRTFGLVFGVVFLLIALYPLLAGGQIRVWSILLCSAFTLTAVALPAVLAPLNRAWTRFGLLLHRITSPIVLGFMFFIVVTPTGWLMRALGKDFLRLRLDREVATYWIERDPPGPKPDSLPNQF
jgi:Saxitoxin biosynthesis operon protein SxtJ